MSTKGDVLLYVGIAAVTLIVLSRLSGEKGAEAKETEAGLTGGELYQRVPHRPVAPRNCADFIPGVQYVGQVPGGWIVVTGGTVIGQYSDLKKAQAAYNLIVCGTLA